jgi:hypothetical protein
MGARLTLDSREIIDPTAHVQGEHGGRCAYAHDHRLCLLIYHAVWSPAPPAPQVSLPNSLALTPLSDSVDSIDQEANVQFARAPPSYARG